MGHEVGVHGLFVEKKEFLSGGEHLAMQIQSGAGIPLCKG